METVKQNPEKAKLNLEEISGDLQNIGGQAQKDSLKDELLKGVFHFEAEYANRDRVYTKLLEKYIDRYNEKSRDNRAYKRRFFNCVMLVFGLVIVLSMAAILLLALKRAFQPADIATVAGAVAGSISAIIILPRIIAEHLFPKDEDQNMISLIQKMQENDSEIRDHFQINER